MISAYVNRSVPLEYTLNVNRLIVSQCENKGAWEGYRKYENLEKKEKKQITTGQL
jgi:hypothetical protein